MRQSQELLDILREASAAVTNHTARVFSSIKGDTRHVAIALKVIASSRELMAEVDAAMARRMLPPASARTSDHPSPLIPLIWWDIYPPPPCAIRLGEVEAADEREAIEKAARTFGQDPAKLTAMRQFGVRCMARHRSPESHRADALWDPTPTR
jgi:hypothetical protein